MTFLEKIEKLGKSGRLPLEITDILVQFYSSYKEAVEKNKGDIETCHLILDRFLDQILLQHESPFVFPLYHKKITAPFDYYRFGLDLFGPLIEKNASKVVGLDKADEITAYLSKGENVILFGNHQTEPDPQAICLLLEKTHPKLVEEMIFVAGDRVVTDPVAVPLSKGLNLLCIYSKNYIEHPPEKKHEKVSHNQQTMKKMRGILSEGGKCIYVAPSGGRDRRNQQGHIEVAHFDPQSIEMFWFIANHATKLTHFYPLALATHNLLPPPDSVSIKLGESRHPQCTPIHLALGSEIEMNGLSTPEHFDKIERRKARAQYIWGLVKELYNKIQK